MALVYKSTGVRTFRLSRGMRDRMLVRSGSLSRYPKGWHHQLLRIESLFTITPRAGGYRARLGFLSDRRYDEIATDDRSRVLAEYGRLRFEVFDDVGRREVLAGLSERVRGRRLNLADRVRYEFPNNARDLSMSLYVDLAANELPHEPILPVLRSVLRCAPATFPFGRVTLYYDPRPG